MLFAGSGVMAIFITLGLAGMIPFIVGLLGFSRRILYAMTAALICGQIYLLVTTSSIALKFLTISQVVLNGIGATLILTLELLFIFVLAHWLGALLRIGLIRVKNRVQ